MFFYVILLLNFYSFGFASYFNQSDSLSVDVNVGASVYRFKSEVPHAYEKGRAYIGVNHSFTNCVSVYTSLKISRLLESGMLRDAYFSYKNSYHKINLGYLTIQEGAVKLYNQHNVFSRFDDNPLLLSYWGTGFLYKFSKNSLNISSSILINGRESGFADIKFTYKLNNFELILQSSLESYDMVYNDNLVSGIVELNYKGSIIKINSGYRYRKLLGFDSIHNKTMIPGYDMFGYVETSLNLTDKLKNNSIVKYSVFDGKYYQDDGFIGSEICYRLFPVVALKMGIKYVIFNKIDDFDVSFGTVLNYKKIIFGNIEVGREGFMNNSNKYYFRGSLCYKY